MSVKAALQITSVQIWACRLLIQLILVMMVLCVMEVLGDLNQLIQLLVIFAQLDHTAKVVLKSNAMVVH